MHPSNLEVYLITPIHPSIIILPLLYLHLYKWLGHHHPYIIAARLDRSLLYL